MYIYIYLLCRLMCVNEVGRDNKKKVTCICICILILTCVYIRVVLHMCVCMCIQLNICIFKYVSLYMYSGTYACIHMCVSFDHLHTCDELFCTTSQVLGKALRTFTNVQWALRTSPSSPKFSEYIYIYIYIQNGCLKEAQTI